MGEKYQKENPIKAILKKLPPNYPMASLIVNGGLAEVAAFTTYSDGVAYYINAECAVSLFDAGKINGINFGAAEAAEPVEEEA
jgi:hypothetical protein